MSALRDRLAENLAVIRQRMADACARSGRAADAVRLIAVTKSGSIEAVQQLVDLGVTELGESRPQQLLDRAAVIHGDVRWHLIGHLQRNKARRIIPAIACIHSIDSLRLLQTLESIAGELGVRLQGLLEVNVSGEEAKDGFAPDELLASVDALAGLQHVQIKGLMTMAPYSEDPETARPVFAALRTFRDQLAARLPSHALAELSMGMSGDFEVAIEEGATLVRVGSSLFEGLPE
ncbi:MAG: YggS family pyridoxal phosphate-dependent enzyme [Planctomycetaceae bacterium]|nr:YggS family pyridoxal phosphate-dependent enzyme [Planctomycetaceae bacterium]